MFDEEISSDRVGVVKSMSHTVPVLLRSIEVVRAIANASSHRDISPKSLSLETGIPFVTCYRILRTLVSQDWIRQIPGGGYELSVGLISLVGQKSSYDQLVWLIRPELLNLSKKVGLTSKVSIRCGDFAITLCRCNSSRETSISVREGARFHLAYGSSGAVLLNQLPKDEVSEILARAPKECWDHQTRNEVERRLMDIRKQGYCMDEGTYNIGYFGMSIPLVVKKPVVNAALTVIGFPNDFIRSRREPLREELLAASKRLSKSLSSLPYSTIL